MKTETLRRATHRETCSLEIAAIRLGIGRNQAYEAVLRGDFPVPVIKIGSRHKVPIKPLDRLLNGETK